MSLNPPPHASRMTSRMPGAFHQRNGGPCSFTKLLLSTWRGVSGHFFFDVLRLALLRPSYRGRRAGVDSFRFLRLLMGWPSLCFQALNDVGHGEFRLGRDHQAVASIKRQSRPCWSRAHAGGQRGTSMACKLPLYRATGPAIAAETQVGRLSGKRQPPPASGMGKDRRSGRSPDCSHTALKYFAAWRSRTRSRPHAVPGDFGCRHSLTSKIA